MPDEELFPIKNATRGLLYPSESDSPFEVFRWNSAEADAKNAVAAVVPGALIEEISVDRFFAELEAGDEGQRFTQLRRALTAALGGVRVFRAGRVEVQIYLVGRLHSGPWAGVHTTSIET